MLGTNAASVSPSLRRRGQAVLNQVLELLESRRLLANVPPGFNTDVPYGGTFANGTAMDFSPDGRLWATTQGINNIGQVFVIQPGGAAQATVALAAEQPDALFLDFSDVDAAQEAILQ